MVQHSPYSAKHPEYSGFEAYPVFAHRSLDEASGIMNPNSFEMADLHETGVECDIFQLADGEFGVVHNNDIGGISQEEVEAMTHGELAAYCVDNGYPNPPTLKEYLGLGIDRGNKLRFELKASSTEKAVEAGEALAEKLIRIEDELLEESRLRGLERNDQVLYTMEAYRVISFSIDGLEAFKSMYGKLIQAPATQRVELMWPSAPFRDDEMAISEGIYKEAQKALGAAVREGYITEERARHLLSGRYNMDEEFNNVGSQDTVATGNFKDIETDEWVMLGALVSKRHEFDGFGIYFRALNKDTVAKIKNLGLTVTVFGCNTSETSSDMLEKGVDVVMTENKEP